MTMDINRSKMIKINRIFTIVLYVCGSIPAITLLFNLCKVISIFITLGKSAADPVSTFTGVLSSAAILAVFIWSYFKKRNGTIASVAVIFIWWFASLASWGIDILVLLAAVIGIAAQLVCLMQYQKLEQLKTQPGYPDFNGIFLHSTNNRILSDEQVRERSKENKNAAIEELRFDGGELSNNVKPVSTDHFMEDIFTDDLNGD